ncbi:MAG: hypothetical protein ABIT37_24585 [Luteolibacter sp.]
MKTRSILTLLLTLGFCVGAADAKGQAKAHKNRDTNGDKILTKDEFIADRKHPEKAAKRFEKADANHDGQLDKSERAALKKHGGKHHGGKRKHKRNG